MTEGVMTPQEFDPQAEELNLPPELRPLDPETVKQIVAHEISDTIAEAAPDIADDQAKALDYYQGKPFGNELEGRSKVVMTDVRDCIEWITPTLMRMFFGSRKVVRYVPQGPEDTAWAEQATDYAQFLSRRGNAGFTVFLDWFKDALLEKLGAVIVYMDEKEVKELERYANLTELELNMLLIQKGVELVGLDVEQIIERQVDPETGMEMPIELDQYTAHIRRTHTKREVKIEGIPQEELLVARRARVVDDDCPFIGRRKKLTFGDLKAMGLDPDYISTLPQADSTEFSPGSLSRREDENLTPSADFDRPDWASKEIWVTECWIRLDEDGDGYAELRRMLVAGDKGGVEILEDDEVNHVPICTLCPVPVPHKLYGLSWADLIMDLQLIRSMLLRNIMDNVYQTTNQRYEVVEGEVELEDLLTTTPGGYVRVSGPGMIKTLETQPLGTTAMGALEYLHGIREDRTGITRYGQGMDAGTPNSTATGIATMMEAANLRIEMLARIFAETGVTRLWEQLLYVMREAEVRPEVVRIRDEWVEMDHRMWRANYDVEVEVGLGTQQSAVRIDNLMLLHDLQKQILDFDPRMVTAENVLALAERVPEAMGFPTKELFFTTPNLEEPPPEPPPDPKMVEIEQKANQAVIEAQTELETLRFRAQQAALEGQLERERIAADRATRIEVAQIQADAQVRQAEVNANSRRWFGRSAKE